MSQLKRRIGLMLISCIYIYIYICMYASIFPFCMFSFLWVCVFCVCECEHRYVDVEQQEEKEKRGENSACDLIFGREHREQKKQQKTEGRTENRERETENERASKRKSELLSHIQRPTRGCSCYRRTTIEQHLSCLLVSGFFVLCFSSFRFLWFSTTLLGEEL